MPMNPLLVAWMRRQWPAIAAVAVLLLVTLVHQLWFRPSAQRYARALKVATEMGMPLDPAQVPRIMPPRLFARVADNSLPPGRAQDAVNSGQLTAEFLGELTARMSHRNLTVTSTEPGATVNGDRTIQVRAHLRARGRYTDFVMLLDDLVHDPRLYGIDRFALRPDAGGDVQIDLWASRLVLKSGGGT
jgi:hypothetical protein